MDLRILHLAILILAWVSLLWLSVRYPQRTQKPLRGPESTIFFSQLFPDVKN